MRRIVDFSDYQSGVDLDQVAGVMDGAWVKAGDWAYYSTHGGRGEDIHTPALDRYAQLGFPAGSYFFVRPGRTDPLTQIDAWRGLVTSPTAISPMIDLEVPGSLSGASLTAWVDEALYWATDRFGVTPTLYWSQSFASGNGMSVPGTPHIPLMAEYHRGYTPFLWANESSWENRAYSAYGGPDVPAGYGLGPLDVVWQFTSSAQVPGFGGLVDCSFAAEYRFQQLLTEGGSLGPAALPEDELTVAQIDELKALIAAGNQDLAQRIYDTHNAVNVRADAIGEVVNPTRADVTALLNACNVFGQNIQTLVNNSSLGPSSVGPVDSQAIAKAVVAALSQALGGVHSLGIADPVPPLSADDLAAEARQLADAKVRAPEAP